MKKYMPDVFIIIILAFIVQWALIHYTPDIVFRIALGRVNGQHNVWIHSGHTDAKMRRVVMPNPDFIYSALFYDVSEKELTVTGVLPDSSYGSIAFYDERCQPYYVYNNLDSQRHGNFTLKLSNEIDSASKIHVKTNSGVIICRYLLKGDSAYQRMRAYQSQLSVK